MLEELWIEAGSHPKGHGMCAMEAVSQITGEGHTDHPESVSPTIRRVVVALNDELTPDARQRLKDYLFSLIGTAWDGHEDERFRILMANKWILRSASKDVVAEIGFAMLDQMLALSKPEDSPEPEPELVLA